MDRLTSMLWSLTLAVVIVSMAAGPALATPLVRITQPTHGQMVTGQIMIQVAYQSDSTQPITRLEVYVDDTLGHEYALATPRASGVQTFAWDFSMASASAHTISVRAVDGAGEVGSSQITVEVTRAETPGGADRVPPVVNIYYPAQGAKVSGEIEIRAEATDNVGVKYVFFYIDGDLHKMIMNAPPFADVWDTTRTTDGPHVLQVKALDEAENSASSAEVTVFVENHTMTTTPAAGLAATPPADAQPSMPGVAVNPGTPVPPTMVAAAPTLTAPTAPVTQRTFGEDTPQATVSGAREIEMAPGQIMPSRFGYIPAISASDATVRTSAPERRIAALPVVEDTNPAATSYSAPSALPEAATVNTQMAALEIAPRLTMPRRSIPELEYTEIAAAGADGWLTVQPVLELTPSAMATPEQRVTSPLTTLTPKETLVSSGMLESDVRTVLIHGPGELTETTIASLGARTSTPALLRTTTDLDVTARDTAVQTLEVAVLPTESLRAAIPANGRMTTPSGVRIAPVARTDFGDIKILFDAEALALLADPEVKDGLSIAPLREIFEHTDGMLYWYPVEKRVRAVNADTDISLQIGDPQVKVNDQTQTLVVAPYIKQGRTMVPLQFIADTLDVTVTFNPDTGQICLTSNKF